MPASDARSLQSCSHMLACLRVIHCVFMFMCAHACVQGWAEMYGSGDGSQEVQAEEAQEEEEEGGAVATANGGAADAPSGLEGLTVDSEGNLPFFFIDAYENTEARPGACAHSLSLTPAHRQRYMHAVAAAQATIQAACDVFFT